MNNIYDQFRTAQKRKEDCQDERSAAFILSGNVSNEVTHVRLNKIKKVALVVNDKEGPDDVSIYSVIEKNSLNNFKKGDYFTWDGTYFLIYEDVRLSNKDLPYIKQRAVECNVVFNVGQTQFIGAFFSTMRGSDDGERMLRSSALVSAEEPLVIVPRNNLFTHGVDFLIENKPWKIRDYDNITNQGISYVYLERNFTSTATTTAPVDPEVIDHTVDVEQEQPPIIPVELFLSPMTEYTFTTKEAYFASVPKVDIIQRTKTSIKFSIPFGIETVIITTYDELSEPITNTYTVVI